MKIDFIYEYINKWENRRDIFIFLNFSVGLVVFFLLIVNEYYCNVDIGLYYMFSLIFSGIREYKIVPYDENNIHSIKYMDIIIEFVLEIIFSIWGTYSLYQNCLQKYKYIYIYGIFSLLLHYFMCIIYIMRWRIYMKKICKFLNCKICCYKKNSDDKNEVLIKNNYDFIEENNDFQNEDNKSEDSLIYSSESDIQL